MGIGLIAVCAAGDAGGLMAAAAAAGEPNAVRIGTVVPGSPGVRYVGAA
jgi:hypothetical protein